HERIPARPAEQAKVLPEEPIALHCREVDHHVAQCRTAARLGVGCVGEHTAGKVVQGEVAIGAVGALNPGYEKGHSAVSAEMSPLRADISITSQRSASKRVSISTSVLPP